MLLEVTDFGFKVVLGLDPQKKVLWSLSQSWDFNFVYFVQSDVYLLC